MDNAPLWTIELTLIPSAAVFTHAEREALRGIKGRRRQGNPMACACCSTTLGAAPFVVVIGRVLDAEAAEVTAGVCRNCGPSVEVAAGRAAKIVRGIWPKLAEYEVDSLNGVLLHDPSKPGDQS